MTETCPACGGWDLEGFHRVDDVPVNSCLLLEGQAEAREFTRGTLDLATCHDCGFITNRAFEPRLAEYSSRYEETQSFSPRFVEFGRDLAARWVEQYRLADCHVLEIGCGKGEFLLWMVDAGVGSGTGIDPGVQPARLTGEGTDRIEWIADFYDRRFASLQADAVVCRHTLEHIHDVAGFMAMLRENIAGWRHEPVVLFELPDVARVLEEVAFWDTYYEHCSYFSAGSLVRLFRRSGFEVLDVSRAYDDQYLLIEARPGTADIDPSPQPLEEDLRDLEKAAGLFRDGYDAMVQRWRWELARVTARGSAAVIWGGGSKGVAFLTVPGLAEHVRGVVDINPHKQGRYLAGSGHRVLAPAELVDLAPELVIAMNPVYLDEIRAELDRLGLEGTELVGV